MGLSFTALSYAVVLVVKEDKHANEKSRRQKFANERAGEMDNLYCVGVQGRCRVWKIGSGSEACRVKGASRQSGPEWPPG